MTATEIVDQYRERDVRIEAMLSAVGECPFCGNAARGGCHHGEGCILAPVETCGKPVADEIEAGAWIPCPLRVGHAGACWPD